MVVERSNLKMILDAERNMYSKYMFNSSSRYILAKFKREPVRIILDFLIYSRKCDFHKKYNQTNKGFFNKILYLYYVRKKNILGERLGLEIDTSNTGEGLMIYHYNNVVNGGSVIGRNCRLHGNNCIGNDGKSNRCPIIGDNVSLGVGAKIIGEVTIANNIKIAAGAVVVHSFLEEGITIGGIPARKLK